MMPISALAIDLKKTGEAVDSRAKLHLAAFDFRSGPAPSPALGNDEIHLWHGTTDGSAAQAEGFVDLLSEDERARMGRFHFANDRRNFALARGMLRTLLGRYLETSPQVLRFSYSQQGKPYLAAPYSETGLEFNLSHSGGRVLAAICRERQVGIDIEKLRDDIDIDAVSERFFSASERDALTKIPPALRRAAFFHCWTRKEALVKAQGDGLVFPLDLFDVSVDVDREEIALRTRPDPAEAHQWRISSVAVAAGYAAAVAVRIHSPMRAGSSRWN